MSKRWPFDLRVRSLLRRFLKAAEVVQKPYAVGGALAMAAHGYTRQTQDVDAFLQHEDRIEWFRALRAQGLKIIPIFTGVQYMAMDPKYKDPEIRIDLLLPAGDPELSAVEMPETGDIGGIAAEVFPLDLLVISKFISSRDEDHHDVDVMYKRGLFNPAEVALTLKHVEPTRVNEFLEKYP
jgi:hypothetical protein